MKAQTRRKVLQAIEDLGYRPNRIAQGLKLGRYSFVGVVVDHMSEITSVLIQEIVRTCRAEGYTLALCITGEKPNLADNWIGENAYIEGIVYLAGGIREVPWKNAAGLPSIYAYCLPPGNQENCIYPDNTQGAADAVKYLQSFGHQRIAYVNGPPQWEAHTSRFNGYIQAMNEAGLKPLDDWLVQGDGTFESGRRLGHQLLDLEVATRPTAVFACSDRMAIGVMEAARDRGISIPDELSIVGFEDREFAEYAVPALTTVDLPLKEVGKLAAARLLEKVKAGKAEAWPLTKVGCRLVKRASVGPPPAR